VIIFYADASSWALEFYSASNPMDVVDLPARLKKAEL
jgi:hypothetical protein